MASAEPAKQPRQKPLAPTRVVQTGAARGPAQDAAGRCRSNSTGVHARTLHMRHRAGSQAGRAYYSAYLCSRPTRSDTILGRVGAGETGCVRSWIVDTLCYQAYALAGEDVAS